MENIEKRKKMPKVLVIIPCYNEEQSIADVISSIKKLHLPQVSIDYIVVNDGSSDHSLDVLRAENANYLNLAVNSGIGVTVQTGYQYALENDYDIAIQFDGDGQHDATYTEDIIKPILNNKADFVIGSRFIKQNDDNFKSTFARRVGINILSGLIKALSGHTIKDVTSGFRAADKKVIALFAGQYPHEYPEPVTDLVLARMGFSIYEVPVRMQERKYGKSSITLFKSGYYMLNVIFLFFVNLITTRRKK